MMSGCLYGVGVGPGDPELMTLKAARVLCECKVVAYFSKAGKPGHAYGVAAALLDGHEEMPLIYPVTTEYKADDPIYVEKIGGFYEASAGRIARVLEQGRDVALLCIGDPFFYGSFMHIYRRLHGYFPCRVVPGITSMSGCWTQAGTPMTWGDDVMTVLPGTLDVEALAQRLRVTDAAVIMKLGGNFARVRGALIEAGMLERAIYIEYGTMQAERIIPMTEKTGDAAPYFSLIVVPGRGRAV